MQNQNSPIPVYQEDKRIKELVERETCVRHNDMEELTVTIDVNSGMLSEYVRDLYFRMSNNRAIANLGDMPFTEEEFLSYCEDRIRDRVNFTNGKFKEMQYDTTVTIAIPALLGNYLKLIGPCENTNQTVKLVPNMDGEYKLEKKKADLISAFLCDIATRGFAIATRIPNNKQGFLDFMLLTNLDNKIMSMYDVPPTLSIPAAILGLKQDFSYYSAKAYDLSLATRNAVRNVIEAVVTDYAG